MGFYAGRGYALIADSFVLVMLLVEHVPRPRRGADNGAVGVQADRNARGVAPGPGGLSVALEFRPHVILPDIGMPGMSVLDVARELCRRSGLSPRIIAVNGWGQGPPVRH